MGVSRGFKLNEINKQDVVKVSESDKGNLIIKLKNSSEWFFVYDENGKKISISEAKKRASIVLKEFAGNEDVLRFIVSQLPDNSKEKSN